MKPWQLGDGDNTVQTDQLRQEFIYDRINRELLLAGINDPTTFAAFASYLGYSTGGGCTYQDMQVAWTPSNLKLGELIQVRNDGPVPNITTLVYGGVSYPLGFAINYFPDLVSLSLPNATSIDPLINGTGTLQMINNPKLVTISAPLIAAVGWQVDIYGNTLLVSIDLQSLVASDAAGITCINNPSLSTINLASLVPFNGKNYLFTGNALDAPTVNQILARAVANAGFVSGLVDLSGGTSDPPNGQGIIDKGILNGRLPGLAVTN